MPGTGGGLKTIVLFPWWSFIFPSAPSLGDPALAVDLGGWRRVYTFSIAVLKVGKNEKMSTVSANLCHIFKIHKNVTNF